MVVTVKGPVEPVSPAAVVETSPATGTSSEPAQAPRAPMAGTRQGISAEKEPNNGPAEANPAALGKAFTTSIQQQGDSDWFKLQVPGQGYVRVMAKDVPGSIKPQVRYCTYDEWKDEVKIIREWKYLPDACAVQKGEYYVQLIDDYGNGSSPENFTLRIDFIDEMDPVEPNDSPRTAKEFALGSTRQAAIFPVGDTDWFKVAVAEQGYVQVVAKGAKDGVKPQVRYCTFNEWKDEVTVHRDWRYLPDGFAVTKGEYYLQMIDDYGDRASTELFDVKLDFLAEFDKGEPNNSPKEATTVASGTVFSPAIYPVGDTDWYRIAVPGQGYVCASARNVPEAIKVQVQYGIYDEQKEEMKTVREWKYLPDACAVSKGVLYVEVIDDYGNGACVEAFPMKLEFVPEFDTAEPNNSFSDAKTLGAGGTARMAIYPVGDVDCYMFTATGPGKVEVSAANPEGVVLQVALFRSAEEQLSEWRNLPAEVEVPAGGAYCLVFIDDYQDAASDQLVELHVSGDILAPAVAPEQPAQPESASKSPQARAKTPADVPDFDLKLEAVLAAEGNQEGAASATETPQVAEPGPKPEAPAPEAPEIEYVPCPRCGGDGKIREPQTCPNCSGKGWVEKKCLKCGGDGWIKDQFNWQKKEKCPNCNGTGKVKSKCARCGGDGTIKDLLQEKPCPRCGGTGKIRK